MSRAQEAGGEGKMSGTLPFGVYRGTRPASRPWLAMSLAVAVASLVFLLVPLTELLARRDPPAQAEVRRLVAPPPEPPPPPPEPEPPREKPKLTAIQTPPPQLKPVSQPLQLSQLDVRLNPEVGDFIRGDFQLDFSMSGPVVSDFKVFELSEVDQKPGVQYQVTPRYPRALERSGVSGSVMVQLVVGVDGLPRDARVVESTHVDFNAPALEAVRRFRFTPSIKDGQKVPVWVKIPFQFQAPRSR